MDFRESHGFPRRGPAGIGESGRGYGWGKVIGDFFTGRRYEKMELTWCLEIVASIVVR